MTNTLQPSSTRPSMASVKPEIRDVRRDKDGNAWFKLHLALADGSQITISGFRYYRATDELKPPCYRAGKGWQPTVRLAGPILDQLHEEVRRLALARIYPTSS